MNIEILSNLSNPFNLTKETKIMLSLNVYDGKMVLESAVFGDNNESLQSVLSLAIKKMENSVIVIDPFDHSYFMELCKIHNKEVPDSITWIQIAQKLECDSFCL
jgi:hypothetical protein